MQRGNKNRRAAETALTSVTMKNKQTHRHTNAELVTRNGTDIHETLSRMIIYTIFVWFQFMYSY